ncbi:porin [Shewanella sp. JBTF-M18]|uniref:Porin n=2 Tax=Shewanella insulae TaxID=2681496 RepID=A0A6L7HSU9_9GAMM|nr:porin [Shewanella insulae]MXR67359.1 porin [Shewanella insulae]
MMIMKTFTLTLLASSLFVAPQVIAGELVDFYGRLDYSVTHSDSGSATHSGKSGTILENNFSRIGVKGQTGLVADWSLFYKIEVGVNGASQDKANKPFSARPTFIGFKHPQAGQLAIGRIDPVFKMSKGFADAFDNYSLKHDRLMPGDKRHGDSLEYKSPKWNKLQLGVSYLMEDNYFNDSDLRKDNGNYQIAVTYADKFFKASDFYFGIAYSDGIEDIKATRFVGHVKFDNLKLGTIIQQTELVNPTKPHYQERDGVGYILSATYQIEQLLLKAQFGSDDSGTGKIAGRVYDALGESALVVPEVSQWAVGAEYRLSKSARIHTEIGQFDVKQYEDFDDTVVSLGFRYDF